MNEILVLDIETTGFNTKIDYIVEVGIVKLNLDTGDIQPILNYVVHEDGITEEAIAKSWIVNNSSLTVEQVKYSVNFKRIKDIIQKLADRYPCTAFNRKFDFSFLESRGLTFNQKYPCPMLGLTPIIKLPATNPRFGKYKYPKVQEAYDYFFPDNDYVEQHRGFDDAEHEAQIIYKLHCLTNKNENE